MNLLTKFRNLAKRKEVIAILVLLFVNVSCNNEYRTDLIENTDEISLLNQTSKMASE